MNNKSQVAIGSLSILWNFLNWFFGILFFAIGFVNSFWGNDPFFGLFIIILSMAYFPPVTTIVQKTTGLRIPMIVKFLLGLFILWAALGVGELFDKVDMMLTDLR